MKKLLSLSNKTPGWLLVILLSTAAFLPYLGSGSLWDRDETNYALVAKEMLASGNWSVPYRNGELFLHKPVFTYWFIAAAYKLFGVSEFSARFFSAVFGVFTSLLVYRLGTIMFNRSAGLFGSLIFITSLMVAFIFRASLTDSYLVFFITASLLFFRYAQKTGKWNFLYATYGMMGLAVLVKGPIGALLPMGTIFIYLLVSKQLYLLKELKLIKGGLILLLVVTPWLSTIVQASEGKFWSEFILKHHVHRFLQPMEGHGGSFWYYLPVIIVGFFPWASFLPGSLFHLYRTDRDSFTFLICWSGLVFLFFSLGATKLPHYILPLFPPLALLLGVYWNDWIGEPSRKRWEEKGFLLMVTIVTVLCLGTFLLYVYSYSMASYKFVVTMGLLNLVVIGGYWLLTQNRNKASFSLLVTGMVIFYGVLAGYAVPQVESSRIMVKIAKKAGQLAGQKDKLYAYGFFEPGLAFYSGQSIGRLSSPPELKLILNRPERFFMFIRKQDFDDIKGIENLYKIVEGQGINEVKGEMHLLLLSNHSLS